MCLAEMICLLRNVSISFFHGTITKKRVVVVVFSRHEDLSIYIHLTRKIIRV